MTEIKRTFGADENGKHFCELRAYLPETDPGFPGFIGLNVYADGGDEDPGIQAITVGERVIQARLQQREEDLKKGRAYAKSLYVESVCIKD